MPGWHEATKALQAQGKVQMVGIIEEQHPDRCALFMQWKRMGWPILVDSLNLLEVTAVPITLAIDEHSIVRMVRPSPADIEAKFINQTFEAPNSSTPAKTTKPDLDTMKKAAAIGTVPVLRAYADALVMWGGAERLSEAIDSYQRALHYDPMIGAFDAFTHFRLGVAYRRRYESVEPGGSQHRQPNDFQRAIDSWARNLDLDPNQYISRRRIQQYGPRLDKPYSFYDWVLTARQDLAARGEKPLPLAIEPGGAEFATPQKTFISRETTARDPDPRGRITRDDKLINIEATVAPAAVAPGGSVRVHLTMRPNAKMKAHWNNEAGESLVWVNAPNGWEVDNRSITATKAMRTLSTEARKIEFELRAPPGAKAERVTIPAYALYYVCEDVTGTCLYRRQEVAVTVEVKAAH